MLNPDARTVFLNALRPPDGFEVDVAIATTYSLDLTAMLLAPLSFARLDGFRRPPVPGASTVESIDPFALLKAIRTFAEKTTVFCQSGQISVPPAYHRLHAYLEQSIVQVTPASDVGVFHPKVWAIRMVGQDDEIRYRVLCLSRNLTFDTCWDTALTIEGDLDPSRVRAHAANHPLGDFFAALPGLAVGPVSKRSKAAAEQVADELRRIEFEFPEGFDTYQFAPIGIGKYQGMPFADSRCDRRLVVSPFVTNGAIANLPGEGGTLVSRMEELDELSSESLQKFEKVFVLSDGADQLEDEPEQAEAKSSEWSAPPSGLHAKLYVFDEGWNAIVWSGSANATTAAFSQNVEFLVGLGGKKSKVGVGAAHVRVDASAVPGQGKAGRRARCAAQARSSATEGAGGARARQLEGPRPGRLGRYLQSQPVLE
jgi:PLD-like domain